MSKKKIFFIGSFSKENFGDDWMMSSLRESLSHCQLSFLGQKASPSTPELNRFNLGLIINEISRANLIVIGPGSLFQVITSWYHNLYYVLIILISRGFKKKIITFGLGSEALPNLLKRIILASLPKKTTWYVRDTYTLNLLSKNKNKIINKHCFSMPDITLMSKIKPATKVNPDHLALCISPKRLSPKVFESIKIIKECFYLDVLLYTQAQEQDACKKLANTFKISHVYHINDWHQQSPPEVLPGIFLSTRYHVAIWAALKGCVFICHNQQEKCIQLAKQFSAPCLNWEDTSNLIRTISKLQNIFTQTQVEFNSFIQFQKNRLEPKITTLFS